MWWPLADHCSVEELLKQARSYTPDQNDVSNVLASVAFVKAASSQKLYDQHLTRALCTNLAPLRQSAIVALTCELDVYPLTRLR